MKKIITLALIAFVLSFASSALAASDRIGYIDATLVLLSHPRYEQTQKHMNEFVTKKDEEVRVAAEKETDPQKRIALLEEARRASGDEEVRVMNPITEQINEIIKKVSAAKGVTVILEKTSIFFGGVDITEDVIKELKALK